MINSEIEKKSPDNSAFYHFGGFCLDSRRNVLTASGEPVALTYKAIQTLHVLVENQGRIVTKDELLERVWQDTFVEDNSLTRNISVLRKIFGEEPNSKKFIETVPRRGYRFIAEVTKTFDYTIDDVKTESPLLTDEIETVRNEPSASSDYESPQTTDQNNSSDSDRRKIPAVDLKEQKFIAGPQFKTRSGKRYRIAALLIVLIAAGTALVFLGKSAKNFFVGGAAADDNARLAVTKFTNTGTAQDAAISPDGKYVVYVANDGAKQSLWIRQTNESSAAVQIFPPSKVSFQGLGFAPDGNFIYYNVWDRKGVGEIFRIPILGGVPVKIVHDCMPSVNISPIDGKIAFIRSYSKENELGLLVTDADGGAEKLVVKFNYTEWISSASWSPDGKSLAVDLGTSNAPEKDYFQLQEISVETGERKRLSEKKWVGINQISWLPNGRGLIVNGADDTQKSNLLWQVALPSGDARKLTSEAFGYSGISTATADGSTLVSIQRNINYNVWTAPVNHPEEAVKVTDGRNEGRGTGWMRDGRIVFTSNIDANPSIWIMQADGSGKKQLTGGNSISNNPVVSMADNLIYFTTNRSNRFQIWRMNENGQNLKQMTGDYADGSQYSISPDGKWLIYVRDVPGEPIALWKISTLDDGEPQRLTNYNTHMPSISPNGKFIAYSLWDENQSPPQWSHEIMAFDGGQKVKTLKFPLTVNNGISATQLGWLPDGSGIAYIDFKDKTSNVWVQPLDEKRHAYQLTDFKDGHVFQFNYSPDGKKILFVRGNSLSDIVMVKIS